MSHSTPNSFVNHITRMPPELVYKILDDIPLAYLLQLICDQDIPHLEHCITSHLVLGKVFSVKYLAEIKALYSLYLRVCYLVYGYYPLYMDSLRFDGRSFTKAHHDLLEEEWGVASLRLQDFFRSAIRASTVKILYAYEYSLPVLTHYAPRTIGPKSSWEVTSVDSLREIFENLDAAEMKLNSIKFAQLNRMAAIVQTYPAMVRTLRDLGQDHHRNDQHLIDMLLRRARDMQKRQIAKQRIVAKCVFHTRRLYLVPHDRLLRLFLKTLEKFPSKDANKIRKANAIPHQYPQQIKEVLDGLPLVYPRSIINGAEETPLSRVPYKKKRLSGAKQQEPYFKKEPYVHKVAAKDSLAPASDQELDWLEAFLGICQYMANMSEEWNPGQTVADYWLSH